MKKRLVLMTAIFIMALSSLTAYAAPQTMPDGTVFDSEYYAQSNPDVVAVFGTDADSLYMHYQLCGKAEGRLAVKPDTRKVDYPKQVLELVNQARGGSNLSWDDTLASAAAIRAKELTQSFSHTRPDGSNPLKMVPYGWKGENIAAGYPTPESVMNGWMNSPGHRENILRSNFSKIGVGYYVDESGQAYWVQLFGG